jgi:hypothetical protein
MRREETKTVKLVTKINVEGKRGRPKKEMVGYN